MRFTYWITGNAKNMSGCLIVFMSEKINASHEHQFHIACR